MIDDAFLRHVAALQANLKMLESQSDALSDLADMKELRLYKSRLTEYIEAHTKAGNLPEDPFQVIAQRLGPISKFFTKAKEECKRLTDWKADWLKSVPAVSLSDLQVAKTELDEIVDSNPQIQEYLRGYLSSIDWDTSSDKVDLHPELLACAQCLSDLSLPQKAEDRLGFYLFAHNEGHAAKNIASHFEAVRLRIEELIELHESHACAFVEAERHLENHDFRKAEKFIESFGKFRFSDLDYARVESRLKNLQSQFEQFKNLESKIDERLQQGRHKEISKKIHELRMLITKPDSELGRDSLELLGRMEKHFSEAEESRRDHLIMSLVATFIAVAIFSSLFIYEHLKTAKAERVAVEAKAKTEEAYKKFPGSRAGEERVWQIAPGVTMTFCWCPAGQFMMGIPSSEADRGSNEEQVKVTLSKGFWMGKTEVTQAQWLAVIGSNPSHFRGTNIPVEKVSWNDAREFLKKIDEVLAATDGWKTMLPTEAQWEYAARAGESWLYSGSDKLDEVAWYGDNSSDKTNSVGMKKANAWGLHDMSGNVMEWCRDWYGEKLPGGTDPQGAASGTYRVIRGGSWFLDAGYGRVASRYDDAPTYAGNSIGFRVLRSSGP
jgi:formylglycine-generating enzyme required for sulfatase activity